MTAAPAPPTVFLVDDDASVLRAVARLLRAAGLTVAEFPSAAAFLAHDDPDPAGCLVLDVAMPDMDGPDLHRLLTRADRHLPVIFLTGRGDLPAAVAAMKAGAVDFLTKPCDDAALLDAVARGLAIDLDRRRRRDDARVLADLLATLTPREHQVMLGVVAGRMNKQIADDLGTAEKTVKTQRGSMMQKLGVTTVADLVLLADRTALSYP